jgi:hypothetical protein
MLTGDVLAARLSFEAASTGALESNGVIGVLEGDVEILGSCKYVYIIRRVILFGKGAPQPFDDSPQLTTTEKLKIIHTSAVK